MTQTTLTLLRKAAKMSQEDVAKSLGCSRDTIRRWEKGRVDIPARAIPQLASIYHRESSEILQAINGNPPQSLEATMESE